MDNNGNGKRGRPRPTDIINGYQERVEEALAGIQLSRIQFEKGMALLDATENELKNALILMEQEKAAINAAERFQDQAASRQRTSDGFPIPPPLPMDGAREEPPGVTREELRGKREDPPSPLATARQGREQ